LSEFASFSSSLRPKASPSASSATRWGFCSSALQRGARWQARTLRRAASRARRNPRLSAANRLTQIRQAAGATNGNVQQTLSYTYDAADRLSRTTLANGITIDATYDGADQLTALTYKQASGTVIGDITYAYDKAGRRIKQGGSLITDTNPNLGKIPAGADITTASYDANHRLTNWNGTAYTYDANGNLTNDGARSYTWDSRNQLASLAPVNASGIAPASFSYDPLGRRSGKTVGANTTGFLYDGANFVQELNEANTAQKGTDATQASLVANLLTAGVDATHLRQRLTATGTSITAATPEHLLTDANNNTFAITNSNAGGATPSITARYDYAAYGETTQTTLTGTPSDNSQQYTGRENDNTGLYYYRARYYNPTCARFISEDPIGWASGQVNNYSYVEGNPISFVDPEGLQKGPMPQGTIYRGTGDINGQIWIGNQMRNGAIQNYSSIQRRAQDAFGPGIMSVCVRSTCDIPQPANQCTASNPTGAPSLPTSGPVMSAPGQSRCTCTQWGIAVAGP
jgi:RHS repeat-associated protein